MEFTYFLSFNRLVSKCFYPIQTHLFAADDVVRSRETVPESE